MNGFDFSTLITDRTNADVSVLSTLMAKPLDTWTPEELDAFNNGLLKGGYWWTDLNRVTACMEYLDAELRKYGYESGYKRVKINHSVTESLLPEGYKRLEYIKSTGEQYFLTGIVPSKNTTMEVSFSTTQATACGIAVCDQNWQNRGYGVWGNAVVLGNTTAQPVFYDGERHTVRLENASVYEEETPILAYTGADFTAPVELSVFALNRNGTISEKTEATLYSLTIDGDSFVPCESPDGIVGVYSTGQKRFIKNEGAGKFIAGPTLGVRLPEGYAELEYIESTGTQYIDTGVKPSGSTRVICSASFQVQKTGSWLFGARDGNGVNAYGFLTYESEYRSDYGVTRPRIPSKYGPDLEIDKNGPNTYINGTLVDSADLASFSTKDSLLIGANVTDGGVSGFSKATHKKYYIYNESTLVREYVPCKNGSGVPGMYDTIGGKFYKSSGSDDFIGGPPVMATEIDKNTVLLLHGEEIVDESLYGVPLTNSGVQISNAQSKFGGKSLFFNLTNRLEFSSGVCDFKGNDFTIDWWEYPTSEDSSARMCTQFGVSKTGISVGNLGNGLYINSDYKTSGWDVLSAKNALSNTVGVWTHWAVVRKGSSISTYRNGVRFFSQDIGNIVLTINQTVNAAIGVNPDGEKGFVGYIDEFRISSIARWSENFTPPTEPYGVSESENNGLDPYTWYKEDSPTATQLQKYLSNVSAIRSVFDGLQNTPDAPTSLKNLTIDVANNIEKILLAVNTIIENMKHTVDLGWALGVAHIGLYGGA